MSELSLATSLMGSACVDVTFPAPVPNRGPTATRVRHEGPFHRDNVLLECYIRSDRSLKGLVVQHRTDRPDRWNRRTTSSGGACRERQVSELVYLVGELCPRQFGEFAGVAAVAQCVGAVVTLSSRWTAAE